MRYGFWFFTLALLIICIQLTATFKLVEKSFYQSFAKFKRPLNVDLFLFKNHQRECPACLGVIDGDYALPCKTGFSLMREDNRKAGY